MSKYVDSLPNLIKEDFFRKFIAVFFACLIWYYVNSKISEDETFTDVAVTVELESADMRLVTPPPNISVTLSGPRKNLERLDKSEIEVLIKRGTSATKGRQQTNLTAHNISLKKFKDLRIVKISPRSISYELDQIETKRVPVQIMVKDELNDRFTLEKEPEVNPSVVRIKGTSARLANVDRVFTDIVHLDKNRDKDFELPATILTPEGIELADGYNKVTANFDLKRVNEVLNLKGLTVYTMNIGVDQKADFYVKNTANIWLTGPPDILKELDKENDIRLFVEVTESLDEQSLELKFWTKYPEVKVLDYSQKKFPVFKQAE